MKRIVIYGTGKVGRYYKDNHVDSSEEIVAFIETNKKKDIFLGLPVYSLDEMELFEWDEIHVANSYVETLYALLNKGVDKDRIVICNEKLANDYAVINNLLDIRYNRKIAREYEIQIESDSGFVVMCPMEAENNVFNSNWQSSEFGYNVIFNDDYCRYGTLKLIINEINQNNISGDIAELGVFKGDFAKYLNVSFPDRKLLLFDTFQGFDDNDVKYELENDFTSQKCFDDSNYFMDTSVEHVLLKMRYPDRCEIHKGYFPETIPQENHRYAFVSIDCDLYKPIFEGLRYFYPRLNAGGYIMLHDYNSKDEFRGVKKAVEDFEKENGKICKVPITDRHGTLVITKNM